MGDTFEERGIRSAEEPLGEGYLIGLNLYMTSYMLKFPHYETDQLCTLTQTPIQFEHIIETTV